MWLRMWKDDITGCRWVLFCLWWISSPYVVMVRIYKVLAFNRLLWSSTRCLEILVRFAHHGWANKRTSSPLSWWQQRFATFLWRSKLERYLQRSLDFVIWLERSFNDFRHCPFVSRTLRWRLWSYLSFGWCFITFGDAERTDEMPLEVSAMPWEVSFLHGSLFEHEFYFCAWNKSKTNNVYKPVFDMFCEHDSLI